jgi:hypothetical protein
LYNITPAKNICTTSHQQKHLQHHTSKYICTTPHQQIHLYNITPAKNIGTTDVVQMFFAGVMLYRCIYYCGVVQMFLLV